MNTIQHIENLIEKYFQGETSIAEERELKTYFSKTDIAPHLKSYRSMFGYLNEAQQIKYPDQQTVAKIVPMHKSTNRVWQIAAAIALLLSVWFLLPQQTENQSIAAVDWTEYESENPEEAYEQTMEAFRLLSEAMGGGAKTATKELEHLGDLKHVLE